MVGLLRGEKGLRIYLLAQYMNVTDGRTVYDGIGGTCSTTTWQ